MQLDTDLTGLFGITLAIVALLVRLPRVQSIAAAQTGRRAGCGDRPGFDPAVGRFAGGFCARHDGRSEHRHAGIAGVGIGALILRHVRWSEIRTDLRC